MNLASNYLPEPVRVDEDGNDLDHPGIAWSAYDVDPYTRECECEGPECDPETCPRFVDVCETCHATFSSGWVCLDGGECACEECVTVVESSWDERKARNTARTSTEGGAS